MDYELTKRVLAEFEQHHVDYVVFGAVAVNLQGLARATENLDVFIARMKKGTIRPKDWGDAEALRRRFRLLEE